MSETRWTEEVALLWVEDCRRHWGRVLHGGHLHWCNEWDCLPVDDTTPEIDCCTCFGAGDRDGSSFLSSCPSPSTTGGNK